MFNSELRPRRYEQNNTSKTTVQDAPKHQAKHTPNMKATQYYDSTCKITQVSYKEHSKRSNGLKDTPETRYNNKLKLTAT